MLGSVGPEERTLRLCAGVLRGVGRRALRQTAVLVGEGRAGLGVDGGVLAAPKAA